MESKTELGTEVIEDESDIFWVDGDKVSLLSDVRYNGLIDGDAAGLVEDNNAELKASTVLESDDAIDGIEDDS